MLVFQNNAAFAEGLAQMHAECFDAPWSADEFRDLLRLPTTRGILHENGFILFAQTLDEAEILTLCVLPNARRQGIALKMLRRLQSEMAKGNVTRIYLEVSANNTAAKSLYEQSGFIQTSTRPGYYRENGCAVDAICMAYDIPNQHE